MLFFICNYFKISKKVEYYLKKNNYLKTIIKKHTLKKVKGYFMFLKTLN